MKLENLKNKKIAILGYGAEGKSSADFLIKLGVKDITVLDKNEKLEKQKDIKYILGESYLDKLGDFDIIIKSPGISPYHPKILPFKKKLSSQTQIFFNNYPGRVIAISGTKGKSTTATLAYEALKIYGYNVVLVGNIGTPVLSEIDLLSFQKYDYIIYEISSYMLEDFKPKTFISVLLNIYPDHLDWHNNFKNYKNAKLNLLQESINPIINNDFLDLIDTEDFNVQTFGTQGESYYKGHNFYIGKQKLFNDKKVLLKGEHNKSNITAVLAILNILGIKDFDKIEALLGDFKGLSHRLENIGTYKEITFIDDAISTTPESTIEAIKTFGNNIDTIFLGGTDRGYSFENLVNFLEHYSIKNIVLFPESSKKIKKLLSSSFNILETKQMKEAVRFAFKYTKKGKICLLSTASPSYSLWKNYKQKAKEFKDEILKNQ